jgi:hypothetical protein
VILHLGPQSSSSSPRASLPLRARVTRRCRPLLELLQLCAALPRIAPPLLPPPVPPPLSHAPQSTPVPLAFLNPAHDCPLSLSPSLLQAVLSYKTQPEPLPRLLPSSSSSRHRARRCIPRRNLPRPLHPARIPAAHRFPTFSPSSPT